MLTARTEPEPESKAEAVVSKRARGIRNALYWWSNCNGLCCYKLNKRLASRLTYISQTPIKLQFRLASLFSPRCLMLLMHFRGGAMMSQESTINIMQTMFLGENVS